MDSKKQPTFAFNNNMEVKSLNVGMNAMEESSDFNVCDDIDELMSSIPAPTTQSKQAKDVKIGNDTKQRGQENFVLDLRSNDAKRPKVQIEDRNDRVLTEKDINLLLNSNRLEKEKPAEFPPADKDIDERHTDKQIVTGKKDRPTDLYKMFDLKLPKRTSIPNLSILGTEKILDHKPMTNSYSNASRIETLKQLVENIQNDIDAQKTKETELIKELDHAKSEILKLKEEQKRSKIKFYDALKNSVKKKSLLTRLDRHKDSINETANELAHVKSIVNLIKELQTSEIDVMKEKLETNNIQRQKLMEEQITNNRRMQDEIDRYKGKANEECARRVDCDEQCKELQIQNKEYQEQIKTLEMEKTKNANEIKDITEKLLYTDDRCNKLDKNLSECKKRIEINEEENKQIILINRNLNKELRDQQETAKIVVEKENELQNMKLEEEKTKAELEYVKNDLCDKNAAILDLRTSKTRLKESCTRKMIDKKHQLMTHMTILANLSNDCSDLVSKLSAYKQKNLAENLSKYYQRVFEAECNKYKKDKQSFLTRISDLKVENKKLKKMNKILATKGVNPDDNDLWNVFN